jgi:hypothetical protein
VCYSGQKELDAVVSKRTRTEAAERRNNKAYPQGSAVHTQQKQQEQVQQRILLLYLGLLDLRSGPRPACTPRPRHWGGTTLPLFLQASSRGAPLRTVLVHPIPQLGVLRQCCKVADVPRRRECQRQRGRRRGGFDGVDIVLIGGPRCLWGACGRGRSRRRMTHARLRLGLPQLEGIRRAPRQGELDP